VTDLIALLSILLSPLSWFDCFRVSQGPVTHDSHAERGKRPSEYWTDRSRLNRLVSNLVNALEMTSLFSRYLAHDGNSTFE
jgi:hypothetical protein